jgi:hypothetical protein
MLVKLLQEPFKENYVMWEEFESMKYSKLFEICRLIYRLLQLLVKGHAGNGTFLSQHVDFLMSQVSNRITFSFIFREKIKIITVNIEDGKTLGCHEHNPGNLPREFFVATLVDAVADSKVFGGSEEIQTTTNTGTSHQSLHLPRHSHPLQSKRHL